MNEHTSNPFEKATTEDSRLRLALVGPSGSGKTFSALLIAKHLVPGGKVALIDTERGSASKYASLFDFDRIELDDFWPGKYVEYIQAAVAYGYDVLIIDSLSHAWSGSGGILAMHDKETKQQKGNNTWAAWAKVTPQQTLFIDRILEADIHIISTMRAKTEWGVDERNKPVKIGLAPVQGKGIEYEFDVLADMDMENNMIVTKTRCVALTSRVFPQPGKEVAEILIDWLTASTNGAEAAETPVDAADGGVPVENGKNAPTPTETPNSSKNEYSEDWLTDDFLKELLLLWGLKECFADIEELRDFAKAPALNGTIKKSHKPETIAKRLKADYEGIKAAQEAEALP